MSYKLLFLLLAFIVLITPKCSTTKYVTIKENVSIEKTTYTTHIEPIIKNYCYSCHSGVYPKRGLDLTSYKDVRIQAEKGRLLDRINSVKSPMPTYGLMPINEREAINRWVKNNYLEN